MSRGAGLGGKYPDNSEALNETREIERNSQTTATRRLTDTKTFDERFARIANVVHAFYTHALRKSGVD